MFKNFNVIPTSSRAGYVFKDLKSELCNIMFCFEEVMRYREPCFLAPNGRFVIGYSTFDFLTSFADIDETAGAF